jgi:hypothetical protein
LELFYTGQCTDPPQPRWYNIPYGHINEKDPFLLLKTLFFSREFGTDNLLKGQ